MRYRPVNVRVSDLRSEMLFSHVRTFSRPQYSQTNGNTAVFIPISNCNLPVAMITIFMHTFEVYTEYYCFKANYRDALLIPLHQDLIE